jgi:hypothetical protein
MAHARRIYQSSRLEFRLQVDEGCARQPLIRLHSWENNRLLNVIVDRLLAIKPYESLCFFVGSNSEGGQMASQSVQFSESSLWEEES